MSFQAERNWRYLVEASDDLVHWLQIQSAWTDGQGGGFTSDGDAGYLSRRFYRFSEMDPNTNLNQVVAIQGHVISPTGAPIAGAVVGTSLDGATAVTAADGSFFLITQTQNNNGSLVYTITVTKQGYQTYSSSGSWGDEPRNQTISLNPG